jgi:hypothetical protein
VNQVVTLRCHLFKVERGERFGTEDKGGGYIKEEKHGKNRSTEYETSMANEEVFLG